MAGGTTHIVNWIDSKAMFGDPVTHASNREQMLGYVNRFGPGMVVYWHDFVDSLAAETPSDVIVCHQLPRQWVFPASKTLCTFDTDEDVDTVSGEIGPS